MIGSVYSPGCLYAPPIFLTSTQAGLVSLAAVTILRTAARETKAGRNCFAITCYWVIYPPEGVAIKTMRSLKRSLET